MALIKKPSELTITPLARILLYGQPGIGKTTLALSAHSPVVLDCDRGLHRVAANHLKDAVQVEKWEDCLAFLEEDLKAYKTIVVDTAGKMIDFLTEYTMRTDPRLKKGDGSLSLQGYGVRKAKFSDFLRRVAMLGKHIVFVAHEKEEKDGDVRYIRPEIGGSSGNDLMKDLDLVGYVESIGNKRTISFNATDKFYGKNSANLPARMEIPNYNGKPAVFMGGILEMYQQTIQEKVDMAGKYNELMDLIEENIDNINDAETANEVAGKLQKFEHIWDSKIQASARIRDKAIALSLVFDKEQKTYIDPVKNPATQK